MLLVRPLLYLYKFICSVKNKICLIDYFLLKLVERINFNTYYSGFKKKNVNR